MADKITKVLKRSPQFTLEPVESETETPRKRYITPEKTRQIIDELRLI